MADVADGYAQAIASAQRAARKRAIRTPERDFVRPPGALFEEDFLDKCTRCDDCIKACTPLVIRKTGPEFGARLEGRPLIIPKENPCLFCDGFPCAAACKTGALLISPNRIRIGRASVNDEACYMAKGQPCDYCSNRCPVVPRAIKTQSPGAPARVDGETCTGCGQCAQICPTGAIEIEAAA